MGSYVVRYLSERGHLIHAYDLDPSRVEGLKKCKYKVDQNFSMEDISSAEGSLALNMLPGAIGSVDKGIERAISDNHRPVI